MFRSIQFDLQSGLTWLELWPRPTWLELQSGPTWLELRPRSTKLRTISSRPLARIDSTQTLGPTQLNFLSKPTRL